MSRVGLTLLAVLLLLTVVAGAAAQGAGAAEVAGADQKILAFAALPEFKVPVGEIIYDRYCTFCHGDEGGGDGLNGFALTPGPADLRQVLARRSAREVADIIELGGVAVGKGQGMPSFRATIPAGKLALLQRYLREKIAAQK